MPHAPVAVFAYNRPHHTQRVLESLASNPEFPQTEVYIYCDGPRHPQDAEAVEATRRAARSYASSTVHIKERDDNRGLAGSITSAVSELCFTHGRVIVVEDDLLLSPWFLNFMNAGLDRYEHSDAVMQIAGYMYPVGNPRESDAFFLPFTTSWGWATWARAWQYFDDEMKGTEHVLNDKNVQRRFNLHGAYDYAGLLRLQLKGKVDSWAIRWYLSVFLRNGLTLYPTRTLVENGGFDGSGIHCRFADPFGAQIDPGFRVRRFPEKTEIASVMVPAIENFVRAHAGKIAQIGNHVRRTWRRMLGIAGRSS